MGLRYRNPFKGRPHEAYKRPTVRNDGDAPYHPGFTVNETWGALKRCWRAYRIAAKDKYGTHKDDDEALKYAKRIRKLQFELGIGIAEFPDLGLFGTEPEDVEPASNDCPSNSQKLYDDMMRCPSSNERELFR